jgi:hypothetical protein
MHGILDPPPMSSIECIDIPQFLDWNEAIEAAMSDSTDTMIS